MFFSLSHLWRLSLHLSFRILQISWYLIFYHFSNTIRDFPYSRWSSNPLSHVSFYNQSLDWIKSKNKSSPSFTIIIILHSFLLFQFERKEKITFNSWKDYKNYLYCILTLILINVQEIFQLCSFLNSSSKKLLQNCNNNVLYFILYNK